METENPQKGESIIVYVCMLGVTLSLVGILFYNSISHRSAESKRISKDSIVARDTIVFR